MRGQPLFEKVVELCGVSSVLAPGLVKRALVDGKVSVADATAADYRAALPRLLARLRAYMPEDDAQRRARRITSMLAAVEAGRSVETDDESDSTLVGRVSDALRSGTPAAGAQRPVLPASGEVALPDYDVDEPTQLGRRYTAHELQVIRQSGVAPQGEPAERESDPGSSDGGKPRR